MTKFIYIVHLQAVNDAYERIYKVVTDTPLDLEHGVVLFSDATRYYKPTGLSYNEEGIYSIRWYISLNTINEITLEKING